MTIDRATYKDYVLEHIYSSLQDNRFRSGDRVTESHIAEELGISRAPIREALAELVSAGLLVHKPQVGTFVASMSPREIINAYETRGVLEGYAVREAMADLDEESVGNLEQMTEMMAQYAVKGRRRRLVEVGSEFHETLYGSCDNAQVVRLIDQLSLKLHLLYYRHWADMYSPEEVRQRHLNIVVELRGRKPKVVERVIREHYMETGRKVAALYNGKR